VMIESLRESVPDVPDGRPGEDPVVTPS